MRGLFGESDICLELLEQLILAGGRRVPTPLRERVSRLAGNAGYRLRRTPADPVLAHGFVFDIQGACLMRGGPDEEAPADEQRPAPLPAPPPRPRPLFGTLDWLAWTGVRLDQCRSGELAADPEWAWQVWREAADLARAQPTRERCAAMQEAWAYYWALTEAADDRPAEPARRAA